MRRIRKINQVKQAVIFCGGLGSRLGKITKKTPKPLIRINNKPFIEFIIKNLSRFGIKKILLLCSYKHDLFYKKYHNRSIYGIKISCINEGSPLGTAGSILKAKSSLDDFFFLCNGDTYFDINILDLINYFKKNYLMSLALKNSIDKRYSGVKLLNNTVEKFNFINKLKKNLVNGGFYLLKKDLLNFINKKNFSLENEVMTKLAKKKKISGKEFLNNFIDIGILKDLKKAPQFLKKVQKKPALFLDRDGVINKDLGYVHKYSNFIWLKNIKKIIKFANDNNYYVFVVSNQSGIGRGYYTKNHVDLLHVKINEELRKTGAHIDSFYYAPYYKGSKIYNFTKKDFLKRKPNTGMILECMDKWNIDIKKSIVMGDQESDMLLAKNIKIKNRILVSKDINTYKEFIKINKMHNK